MVTPQTILVPITNSPESFEAVGIAVTLAKPRKGRVYVVHVIEVNRSLPLNAELESEARRGEQLIRRAEEVASELGFQVYGQLLQAREAGQAIVDEARDREVEAIVMGIGYKTLIGSFQVGRTADYVLKNASCQVWVVRQPMAGTKSHSE
ncbi:MAG: universal stress protein [Anaerolinea sp.]|nr:universal stress protein [Anaerolinea sp.]